MSFGQIIRWDGTGGSIACCSTDCRGGVFAFILADVSDQALVTLLKATPSRTWPVDCSKTSGDNLVNFVADGPDATKITRR